MAISKGHWMTLSLLPSMRVFARSLFDERNPVGETVTTSTIGDLKVTVVFADLPDNTHMKYRALFPWKLMKQWAVDDDLARPDMLFNVYDTRLPNS